MNDALIKAKKNCTTTAKVLKVIGIALRIGGLLCAVFMTIAYILLGMAKADKLPDNIAEAYTNSVNEGNITFDNDGTFFGLDIDIEQDTDMSDPATGFLIIGAYATVATIVLLLTGKAVSLIGSIFKEMAESDSPFSGEIIRKSRKVFVFLLIVVILGSGSMLAALVLILSFWCFGSIFLYGKTLQDQVDETL